jgi:hypothetical protein
MEALIAVMVVLIAGTIATCAWAFFYLKDRLNDVNRKSDNVIDSITNGVVSNVARDIDKKFDFYARDPSGALMVNDDGTTAEVGVAGRSGSKLSLGSANITYDNSSEKMSLGTKGTAAVHLTKDAVRVEGGTFRIGKLSFSVLDNNDLKICSHATATPTCRTCSISTGTCTTSS